MYKRRVGRPRKRGRIKGIKNKEGYNSPSIKISKIENRIKTLKKSEFKLNKIKQIIKEKI